EPESSHVEPSLNTERFLTAILGDELDARHGDQGVQRERRPMMSLAVDANGPPLVPGELLPWNGERDQTVGVLEVAAVDVAVGVQRAAEKLAVHVEAIEIAVRAELSGNSQRS